MLSTKPARELRKWESLSKQFAKVKEWKTFCAAKMRLSKAAKSNATITQLKNEFEKPPARGYKKLCCGAASSSKQKDEYHQLFSAAMQDCATKYTEIDTLANELIKGDWVATIGLKISRLAKANSLNQYAHSNERLLLLLLQLILM